MSNLEVIFLGRLAVPPFQRISDLYFPVGNASSGNTAVTPSPHATHGCWLQKMLPPVYCLWETTAFAERSCRGEMYRYDTTLSLFQAQRFANFLLDYLNNP